MLTAVLSMGKWEKSLQYGLHVSLGGLQGQSGRGGFTYGKRRKGNIKNLMVLLRLSFVTPLCVGS